MNQHRSPFIPAPLEAPLKKLPPLVLLSLAACAVFTGGTEVSCDEYNDRIVILNLNEN